MPFQGRLRNAGAGFLDAPVHIGDGHRVQVQQVQGIPFRLWQGRQKSLNGRGTVRRRKPCQDFFQDSPPCSIRIGSSNSSIRSTMSPWARAFWRDNSQSTATARSIFTGGCV